MAEIQNALLLLADALVYFVLLAALFRSRRRLGIGAFFCALGVMHFLETYLASILYVPLPGGIVTSPGSTVLFTGKLMLLLLVYIREDAVVVRQPIYGLLIGNLLLIVLAVVMRNHVPAALTAGPGADFGFLDEMGALMLWGTAVLFVDCILIILLYERSRAWLGNHIFARLLLAGTVVLSFDQLAFFAGLHVLTGADWPVFFGGWIAKMIAVVVYVALLGAYLRWAERSEADWHHAPRISDVFDVLTYRERYEDLLAQTGRDALTGTLDRGRLETQGRRAVEGAISAAHPVSLLLIDIDHFKAFNDRFGHAAGDVVLRRIAASILATVSPTDLVFRFGGEEFVVICVGLELGSALELADRICTDLRKAESPTVPPVTASIGLATAPQDAGDYDTLFATADQRLYQAKSGGRNRVVGERVPGVERLARYVQSGPA